MKKADKRELEALARELVRDYFVNRDYGKLMRYITPQISWFGTGANEVCCSLLDAARYLTQEQELYQGNFIVSDEWYHVCVITDDLACVMVRLTAETDAQNKLLLEVPMRVSVIFARGKNGKWKVCHIHNSVAYREQGEATYFDREAAHESYATVERVAKAIAAEQIESTRNRDLLTGIRNGEGFTQSAEQILREAKGGEAYALIRFGVDNFRYVNQTYGYAVGDDILKSMADALEENCAEHEVCGRVDKDNFALLIRATPEKSAERWMREIEPELIKPQLQVQLQRNLSFSGGIYPVPPAGGEDVKAMLDKAMLTQKWNAESGHSGYLYFDRETYGWELYCASLLEQAPQAILNREFELYIQPQVDLETGRTVSGEALTRWVRTDGTLVMPGDFIPLFEKSDLIIEFDFHMLELLCRQMRLWLDAGMEAPPISVNQSRRHISKPGYIERFCKTVDRYAIPHHLLVFELTESAFVEGSTAVISLTEQLHRLGFQLAIDDFGTGYAALNLLKMGADILKVDKSLLVDVELTHASRIILQKIVEMAKEMKMTVICEGIEERYQLDYLKSLHCDIGQGFYFGRPIPAEGFERRIQEERAIAFV